MHSAEGGPARAATSRGSRRTARATGVVGERGRRLARTTISTQHAALMHNLGVSMTEIASLDSLAEDCARNEHYDFLYVPAPLKVVGDAWRAGEPGRRLMGETEP